MKTTMKMILVAVTTIFWVSMMNKLRGKFNKKVTNRDLNKLMVIMKYKQHLFFNVISKQI